jgi:hypothetical protein
MPQIVKAQRVKLRRERVSVTADTWDGGLLDAGEIWTRAESFISQAA